MNEWTFSQSMSDIDESHKHSWTENSQPDKWCKNGTFKQWWQKSGYWAL